MIGTRINQLIKAYINEGLERIEDPAIMVKQYIRDVREQVEQAEQQLEKALVRKKTLENDLTLARVLFEKREEQARVALQADNEELARKILLNKKEVWKQIAQFEEMLVQQEKSISEKSAKLEQLQTKYSQLQEKHMELIVRVQAVKESGKVNLNEKEKGKANNWNDPNVLDPEWEKESEIEIEINKLKKQMQGN
ncbi:PspA/IM30 family protein [Halalkalibacter alkaliphilus]|uniref:PspA/IM30 family protein n=1 Tax=Halalkalibacter alkaliphilus TaxID=2917993 RepID=A0A9X1ZYD3_9BACI|nr:PspA/IM30 family protein [Halalkalibacter alkaliphilus]MCL7746988.1 PspA/IM30 family protein [Halalkalibacter alkaliphilus]